MYISLIRTVILYTLVVIAVRLMGKRQIGEMQPTELVVTLMISNLATLPMENTSVPILSGAVPILMLVAIEILLSFWMMNCSKLRNIISGRPVVVINNGKIDQKALKELRFTVDDLLEDLRKNSVFDISTIHYAIIETDGTLSVLLKKTDSPATVGDLNLADNEDNFYVAVIQDGKVSKNTLKLIGKDENWLQKILKKEKVSHNDVFIMTINSQEKYTIIKRDEKT